MSSAIAGIEFYIPAIDGSYYGDCSMSTHGNHQLSVRPIGGGLSGELTVLARAPGSGEFEQIPDGTIDLSNPSSVMFMFSVAEYEFQLSGVAGATSGSQLLITDTPLEV